MVKKKKKNPPQKNNLSEALSRFPVFQVISLLTRFKVLDWIGLDSWRSGTSAPRGFYSSSVLCQYFPPCKRNSTVYFLLYFSIVHKEETETVVYLSVEFILMRSGLHSTGDK